MQDIKNLVRRRIRSADIDSVKAHRKNRAGGGDSRKDHATLARAEKAWLNLSDFREQRARVYRFLYGDQFGDMVTVYEAGHPNRMTMREYMEREGNIPMQTNQLQSKLNTLLGVLIKQGNEPVCKAIDAKEQQYGEILTEALNANLRKNKYNKLLRDCVKDFAAGGLGVMKESWGFHIGNSRDEDSWSQYIDPDYFFFENFRDHRGWDVELIGTWYKTSFANISVAFGDTPERFARVSEVYNAQRMAEYGNPNEVTDEADIDNLSFMKSQTLTECCVCEVWTHETKRRIKVHDTNAGTIEYIDADDRESLREISRLNRERIMLANTAGWKADEVQLIECEEFTDEYYYCRMLAPDGTILHEGESTAPDRSYPFIFAITPFVNGRISGYLTEPVDHQIALNRAYCLEDWIVRNQIKGMYMIPTQLLNGRDPESFIKDAIVMGNYFFYDADNAGRYKPEILRPGAVSFDASHFIQTIRQLDESSSAISGAIQGRTTQAGTSGILFQQQTENSATPITAFLTDVKEFQEDAAVKKAKNIAEFYTDERLEKIVGSLAAIASNPDINLNRVADLEYDLEISGVAAQKQYVQSLMLDLFGRNLITFEELVESNALPGGEKILQSRQARQAEAAQLQQQGMMPQQQMGGAPVSASQAPDPYGQQTPQSYGIPQ